MSQQTRPEADAPGASPLSRRTLFAGAGTLGALAAAAVVLPGSQATAPAKPEPVANADEGYRLTEHVKRYYQSARV